MINELFSDFKNSLLGNFSIYLIKLMPKKVSLALFLMVFVSLIQGISLILLIPLLGLVGLNTDQGSMGQFSTYAMYIFKTLGIQINLVNVLTLYVVAISFIAVLNRYQTLITAQIEFNFAAHIRKQLYSAIINSNWLFFSKMSSSNFAHALTNEIERIILGTNQFLLLISSSMILIVYMIIALKLAGILTGIVFIAGVIILFSLRRMTSKSRSSGEDISTTTQDLYFAILQQLEGMKTIKSFNIQTASVNEFSKQTNEVTRNYQSTIRNYADVKVLFDIGTVIILALMVLTLIEIVKLPIAVLFLLIYIFVMMLPQFSVVQHSYQYFINMLPSYENVMKIQEKCEKNYELNKTVSKSHISQLKDKIKFNNVSFQYDNSDKFFINNLNMEIKAGETTALIGSSGSGKSTIADMVIGLIKPKEGTLTWDGILIDGKSSDNWRNQIGYVAQDTFLFNETIRFNLVLSKPEANDDEINSALKKASAYDFVSKLPQGLETVVGDRGVRLSGGEKQRLALARAFLRKPSLLILDESTSNLDSENENKILGAVDQYHGETTVLIIAHRLSTIKCADNIYLLENGEILESGSWEKLLRNKNSSLIELIKSQDIL